MNPSRRMIGLARSARAAFALTVAAGFLGGLLIILQARQISHLVNRVFLEGDGLPQLQGMLLALLLIVLLRTVLSLVGEVAASWVALRVKTMLREMLTQHVLDLGPTGLQNGQTGKLTASVVQGIEALDAYYSQFLPQMVLAAVLPISILVVVFPLDWQTGLILLITAPLIPFFMALVGRTSEALTRRQWTALSRMSAHFLDTIQGLTELKRLNQSLRQTERIATVSERYRLATMAVLRVTFLSALVLELLSTLSTAVVAVEIGIRLLSSRITFEPAFFILLLAPEFYLPLRMVGQRYHASTTGVSAARTIFALLDQPVTPRYVPQPGAPAAITPVFAPPFELKLDEVGYTYPGRTQPALHSISLSVHSGQQVALVGPSGGGKSTLAQLLLRFTDPQQGQILLNGHPIHEIPLERWHSAVAWVPQQPALLSGSLLEAIRLGKPHASLQEVQRVAQLAHLDDFVRTLPQGYDTQIGEGGARLSGGQAQRLALARAFLMDAPLLILDEPTAHLDPEEEALLQVITAELRRGRTVITIAHRLPTVVEAQQIYVLDAGQVVQRGTHAQLVVQEGLYRRLVQAYEGRE